MRSLWAGIASVRVFESPQNGDSRAITVGRAELERVLHLRAGRQLRWSRRRGTRAWSGHPASSRSGPFENRDYWAGHPTDRPDG